MCSEPYLIADLEQPLCVSFAVSELKPSAFIRFNRKDARKLKKILMKCSCMIHIPELDRIFTLINIT